MLSTFFPFLLDSTLCKVNLSFKTSTAMTSLNTVNMNIITRRPSSNSRSQVTAIEKKLGFPALVLTTGEKHVET
jgi:hypothetical protein